MPHQTQLPELRKQAVKAIQDMVVQHEPLPEYIEPLERLIDAVIDRKLSKRR